MDNMKTDPSRTSSIRLRFLRDLRKRILAIRNKTVALIKSDPFGINQNKFTLNAVTYDWKYSTSSEKLKAFQAWFKEQVDTEMLETVGDFGDTPWLAEYVHSAYVLGINRAYMDAKKKDAIGNKEVWDATRAEFVATMLALPRTVQSIRLMYLRSFESLDGINAEMASSLSRIMANGLAHGISIKNLVREVSTTIDTISKDRAHKIVRTEIIHAHAEAQLDAFERLGVEKLGVLAEWSTAKDDRVCKRCAKMEGKIFTIAEARGKIPLHVMCRCTWIPSK